MAAATRTTKRRRDPLPGCCGRGTHKRGGGEQDGQGTDAVGGWRRRVAHGGDGRAEGRKGADGGRRAQAVYCDAQGRGASGEVQEEELRGGRPAMRHRVGQDPRATPRRATKGGGGGGGGRERRRKGGRGLSVKGTRSTSEGPSPANSTESTFEDYCRPFEGIIPRPPRSSPGGGPPPRSQYPAVVPPPPLLSFSHSFSLSYVGSLPRPTFGDAAEHLRMEIGAIDRLREEPPHPRLLTLRHDARGDVGRRGHCGGGGA